MRNDTRVGIRNQYRLGYRLLRIDLFNKDFVFRNIEVAMKKDNTDIIIKPVLNNDIAKNFDGIFCLYFPLFSPGGVLIYGNTANAQMYQSGSRQYRVRRINL
jgi:hypothetical protein